MTASTAEHTNVETTTVFTGQHLHGAVRVVFATTGSAMILCGVIGNWVLIAVILKFLLRKRCVHTLFIANLALADTLTLGYWFTFLVLDLILGYHPLVNNAHCVVNGVIICTLSLVSTCHIY